MLIKVQNSHISGEVKAPSSKSMMQRMVAAAYLSNASTLIMNPGESNDCKASLDVISQLGATVKGSPAGLLIDSSDLSNAQDTMDCGEAGLGIRMFTPIAALSDKKITITGSGSLATRPMDFFEEILPQLGVECTSNNGKIPIEVTGPMQAKEFTLDGSLTSQYLTGLLMALPTCEGDSILHVYGLRSRGYVDLTLNVMEQFGVHVQNDNYETFHIKGSQKYANIASSV
ncbi:MAG: 3-phosphoshikimate 1-carboxyvinyltransferase, partial [Thalassobium sp.]